MGSLWPYIQLRLSASKTEADRGRPAGAEKGAQSFSDSKPSYAVCGGFLAALLPDEQESGEADRHSHQNGNRFSGDPGISGHHGKGIFGGLCELAPAQGENTGAGSQPSWPVSDPAACGGALL